MKHRSMRLEDVAGGTGKKRIVLRLLSCLCVTLLCVAVAACGAVWIICKGPSQEARDRFVVFAMQHELSRQIPALLFSEQELAEILQHTAQPDA